MANVSNPYEINTENNLVVTSWVDEGNYWLKFTMIPSIFADGVTTGYGHTNGNSYGSLINEDTTTHEKGCSINSFSLNIETLKISFTSSEAQLGALNHYSIGCVPTSTAKAYIEADPNTYCLISNFGVASTSFEDHGLYQALYNAAQANSQVTIIITSPEFYGIVENVLPILQNLNNFDISQIKIDIDLNTGNLIINNIITIDNLFSPSENLDTYLMPESGDGQRFVVAPENKFCFTVGTEDLFTIGFKCSQEFNCLSSINLAYGYIIGIVESNQDGNDNSTGFSEFINIVYSQNPDQENLEIVAQNNQLHIGVINPETGEVLDAYTGNAIIFGNFKYVQIMFGHTFYAIFQYLLDENISNFVTFNFTKV